MKITINSYGNTFSWENEGDDTNLAELIPQLKGLLVSVGYHPQNVDECFSPDASEWFPDLEEKTTDALESRVRDLKLDPDDDDNRNDYYYKCSKGKIVEDSDGNQHLIED